nr:titin homolog isoform X1 [Coffea arabica]
MPRSSRHKSHKQSKHSSKEAKDYYSDSDEDVKMKDRNSSKEDGGGSVRVSKDSSHSASGEKRKLSSSSLLREGKDGKDLSGNGNVDVAEEYVSSKRRKDKAEGGSGGAGDRWHGGGGDEKDDGGGIEKEFKGESSKIDLEKGAKFKESKGLGDSKSKSSKRHESGGEKEERNVGLLVEKEESRSSSRSESKRKSDKESGRKEGKDSKEMKDKDRGPDREKKGQESRRDSEMRQADGVLAKKQGSQWEDGSEDRQSKRGRDYTEFAIQDEFRNSESEKDLEKRIRRRRDGSGDGDRSQDARESDERHFSSRGDRAKDGKYKDERYKDGSYGDKNQDDVEKDDRHRDVKYRSDADKDVKYRDDGDRDGRHRDDKFREDGEKDNRRREDKYHEDADRDTRRKDDKYRDDGERDGWRRDDKYREDGERENKRRDDRYREDGDKDSRYHEDGERDDRYKDDKYREDNDRYKVEKRREDYERDSRRKDGKQADDVDKEKRLRDAKYKDERASRDRPGDKSDIKQSRDEIHVADLHSRKSSMRDSSPNYEDRARFKDDQGRKRSSDKDDQIDVKSRSTKDQRYDGDKRLTSGARVDLTSERGRSASRNADLELTPSRNRHQGSPSSSSHVTREHYRLSKQDESKYREYAYEDRSRHGVTPAREYSSAAGVTDKISASRVSEKVVQKDDSHLVEFSAERRLRTDARTSPRQLIDKSPSSTSVDRRHGSRSDVRRSIDVEESGQRSGGSRDAKDYPGKESRGVRDSAVEMLPGDDLSQVDGDNVSVSSPFARTGNFSVSSKSLLPPPFRTGIDSPLNFGSSEDDSRVKFNARHRRISDPNMGRVQGSPWKAVPSWPSPMANGFIPFQHGPPPVGFPPVMQQFPAPPIYGVRPSMELNHPCVPYHISDAERFPGHGRPMGWRNPVDDSCPPPLHGWDANSAPFGEESHIYGRPDWDHSRTLSGGRGWETGGEMWKSSKSDVSMDLPSISEKESRFTGVPVDVALAGQAGQQAQVEQVQPDIPAESIETSKLSDALHKKTPENSKVTTEKALDVPKKSEKDDCNLCRVYLSKLDISADLTDPELYSKCTGLLNVDEKIVSDSEDAKILYVEEALGAKEQVPTPNKKALFFATINDSVFQKAMTLYKKCREEFEVISGENTTLAQLCNKSIIKFDQEMHLSENNKAEQLSSADNEPQPQDAYPNCALEVKQQVFVPKLEEVSPEEEEYQKLDEPAVADVMEKSDKTIMNAKIKEELVNDMDFQEQVLVNSVSIKDVESSTCLEEVVMPSNSRANELASNSEVQILPDSKCGSLLLADVSSKACEVAIPESIESGSVNLSRIHHSPENTH